MPCRIELIYDDLSRTVIELSFADDDPSAVSTQQSHTPPPELPGADALASFSATVGAQVFATAHSKLGDKSFSSGADFVRFCFSRATEPLPPLGSVYGLRVMTIRYDSGGKSKSKQSESIDGLRGGDVVAVREAKFKHGLSTTKVGGSGAPHVAVVSSFDARKRKLRVIERAQGSGAVQEEAYRLEDLKSGSLVVYRPAPRSFVSRD